MKTDQTVKELQEMKAFFQTAIEGSEKNIAMRKRQIRAIDTALEAVAAGRQETAEEQAGEKNVAELSWEVVWKGLLRASPYIIACEIGQFLGREIGQWLSRIL